MSAPTIVPAERISRARRDLDMSVNDLGMELGLAYTNPDPRKRRQNAGDTVRRWEREGAPPWAWLAIVGLYHYRGMVPPAPPPR